MKKQILIDPECDIEATIKKTGEQLSSGLTEKLKCACIHYLEETELVNLEKRGQEHRH